MKGTEGSVDEMTATLRIHRGPASPERAIILGDKEVGHLREEVTDIVLDPGTHVVRVRLGIYSSEALRFKARDGDLVEVTVEDNPDAFAPVLQGGFLRIHRDRAPITD